MKGGGAVCEETQIQAIPVFQWLHKYLTMGFDIVAISCREGDVTMRHAYGQFAVLEIAP